MMEYEELKQSYLSRKLITVEEREVEKWYIKEISKICKTQRSRIKLNPCTDTITFDLKHNRHVKLRLYQLLQLQELFKVDDIIVSSPIRCILELELVKHEEGT